MKKLELRVRLKRGTDPSELRHYGLTWHELDLLNGAHCVDEEENLSIHTATGDIEYKQLTQEVLNTLLRMACDGILEYE